MQHLIHVGFGKAGSSFLRRWFAEHPQIAYVQGGIAGFNSIFDIAREASHGPSVSPVRATSLESLSVPHPYVVNGLDPKALAAGSAADAQAAACRILRELFPTATILIVTRGFRAKILSAYSQLMRNGGNLSFDAFVSGAVHLAKWWHYDYVIGLYEEAFGKDRVLVLPFEMLRDDLDTFQTIICRHIGLDTFPTAPTPENPSISPASLAWYPLYATLAGKLPNGRVRRLYQRLAAGDQLALVAAVMQRIHPLPVPSASEIPESLLAALGRRCGCLRDRPVYRPYLGDYLLAENAVHPD